MGWAYKQMSTERKERLKAVLNEGISILREKETSDSKYHFFRESAGKHERS